MWTDTTREHYARAGLALQSDLTDAEWAVLEPFFPPPSNVGRPRKWPLRRIVEAILYLLRGGLPWRMLPPCFPPVSTVRRWFYLWRDNGLWLSLNDALLLIGREAEGRDLLPKLEANTNWWLMQRMTSLGLISCFDPFETGWDDTPRLDHGPIIACDMNAYLLMQMRSTARIAELCGQIHRADAINLQADGFARTMLEVLYDECKNRFHDVLIATGEKLAIVSPAIYLPLLGDIGLPHEKAVAMIRDGLLDPAQLYGAIPFPCVAYNDPSYDPQQMWRGPMWPQISWLLLELLERFGLHDEREASAQALYRIILDEGNLHEYFNSQTGEGLGFPQQGWTAAIFLRLHGDRMRNRAGRIAGADAP